MIDKKKKREIEANFAITISYATLPEKRKYWCEIFFDKESVGKTSTSKKTLTPEWGELIRHDVLENTKLLRVTLFTIVSKFKSKIEQVGELRIPFAAIISAVNIDKVYTLQIGKKEESKKVENNTKSNDKLPKIRLIMECNPTELYRKNIALEKRRKLILAQQLPRVEIPELSDLMHNKDSESNDSRLSLIKSSKNWKWTTGDTLKRKQSKSNNSFTTLPNNKNNQIENNNNKSTDNLEVLMQGEENIASGYKLVGNDDSAEENSEGDGYAPIDKIKDKESEENSEENLEEGYKQIGDEESKDEDTVDNVTYKQSVDDEKNSEDEVQDGYMVIEDGDDDDDTDIVVDRKSNKLKDSRKLVINSLLDSDGDGSDKEVKYSKKGSSSLVHSNSSNTLYSNTEDLPSSPKIKRETDSPLFQEKSHSKVEQFQYESFNSRFQSLIENLDQLKGTTNTEDIQETNMKLIQLAQDFVASATIYGKLIISEHRLPLDMRTIKPIVIGGYLGGDKYKVNDILFKFANDAHGIFEQLKKTGHDPMWAANKVAGHELKGCIDYFRARVDGLSFPLMALVDYKGYRLIAMSILPINGSETLKYGSNNAGEECDVHTDSEQLLEKISIASKNMNLKGHWCGRKGRDKLLYSAIDLEGHISNKDKRMYVIDYSRSMPPVYPKGKLGMHGQNFFCLFRSEFVKSYKTPLSSDGYSSFQSRDSKDHNEEIKDATIFLIKERIPKISTEILNNFNEYLKTKKPVTKFSLSSHLHTCGINMRYSGYLFEHIPENGDFYNLVFVEILARIVKNRLRHLMRKKLESVRSPLEAPFNILIINNLNALLSGNIQKEYLLKKSKAYWERYIPEQLTPFFKLNEERIKKLGNLKERISKIHFGKLSGKYVLLNRIIEMMGLKFTNDILEELETSTEIFTLTQIFEYTNLKDIGVRVKHMNIIETIQAEMFLTHYLHRGLLQVSDLEALRHYNRALDAIEEEVKKRPTDPQLIIKFANIINKVEKAKFRIKNRKDTKDNLRDRDTSRGESSRDLLADPLTTNDNLIRASKYYEQAINLLHMDTTLLAEYAQFLYFWGDVTRAEEYFLRSLEVDPNQIKTLQTYGNLLLKQGSKIGSSFLTRFGHISGQQSIIEKFLSNSITSSQAAEKLKQIESEHENFTNSFSDSVNLILKTSNLNTTL
eukprot:TRINITY_DN4888_c0_g1_i1.p1 TRINITY_DN4888_c0_g1~~TRINITY_DN4888_c0_g1_i1.p1  ORF type:complete len:1176 (-),score=401.59 TRINITY_DN4888_c0_g1_i1:28-3555(-)